MKYIVVLLIAVMSSLLMLAAGPVSVKKLPGPMAKPLEIAGRGIASKADEEIKKEVAKYARDDIFGITGTLYPSGEVKYLRGGQCKVDGRPGIVLEFEVHCRARIDVGFKKLFVRVVRKVWAVDTRQRWQVIVLPSAGEGGKATAEVRIVQVSATSKKERQAKQKHADSFRDKVTKAIKAKLDRYAGQHDLSTIVKSLGK